MKRQVKVIVEKHTDGYLAYPLGVQGAVVGQGDTDEEALADVRSAIQFHVETFGPKVLESQTPILEAFVATSSGTPNPAPERRSARRRASSGPRRR